MVLQTVKLASLLIKQISRPIVHRLTESAKNHEKLRSIMEQIGQSYHSIDYTLQSKLLGFPKPTRVKSVPDDAALNIGTKILGETLVYVISASFLLYEYKKSQIKENDKTNKLDKIQREMHLQEEQINQIQKDIHLYEEKIEQIQRDIHLNNENKLQIQKDIHLYEEKIAQIQKDVLVMKRNQRPQW